MSNSEKKEDAKSAQDFRNLGSKLVLGMHLIHDTIGIALNMELQKQSEILIIGGGGGKELSTLSKYSKEWQFTVVDPSEKMIQLAGYWVEKEQIGDRTKLLKGYLEDFHLRKASFNAITCIAVLHYLDRNGRQNIFKAVKKLLKPKGVFVWTVAVKPETSQELNYLKRLYFQFPRQNGVDVSVINSMKDSIQQKYKLMTSDEELEMIKSIGFNNRIEIGSTTLFKTYIFRNNN
ncbi:class I SAM-dependent methyltransferase [Tamlana sp. 2201CG12-4]|uniref:class I SAM-dependent methyltransferase n=1 Tax=Tamlana sp. 2201CG12-4 TaxID=3112582 RepID=UPI002DBFD75B|nr:class I SAM-dependent methyltransferase [Tamlana sp. 2201CG12-4]MEC3907637.1 class I SAM-dependent methyltransferase [Tamlana sp. 2201CG12-4]